MTIHLTRHGETTANRERIILGRRDAPLTEAGLMVVERLAAALTYEGTGIIVSSPLGRAVATADVFAQASCWKVTLMDDLCELSCGQWEGMHRLSVLQERQPLRSTWTDAPPGGESCAVAEERVMGVIRCIKKISRDHVIIVGHAVINQVFLKIWRSLEPQEALAIRHPHDLLYSIGVQDIAWMNAAGETGEGLRT